MTFEEFTKNFPPEVPVPNLLERLFEFSQNLNDFFSGYFELATDGVEVASAWFEGNQELASQFIFFGEEADGSSYAYWLYPRRTIETAPIVFLGHGTSTVIANTLEDFLGLLALGYKEIGHCTNSFYFDWDEPVKVTDGLLEFRNWLASQFNIYPPADGRTVVEKAIQNHPNLEKWLEEKLAL